MTSQRRTTIIAGVCLAVSMTACILLLRHLDRMRPQATAEDVLYVESPKAVKRASLGFEGLMACVYWTRTVQYFGHRHHNHEMTYNELAPLLEITTTLDPHLLPAYELGASFLAPHPPNGAGQPDRAIQLMEYGIARNPDNWRLYYDLAFIYYTELNDYRKASEIFDRGSRVPNAHPFMKLMAAQTAEHAGDYRTARMLWSATFDSSRQTEIRQNALEHLRAIQVDEVVAHLQAGVTRFGERTGRLPSSIEELCAAEHLPGVPADPDGNVYTMTPEGRILIQNPDDFPFISKGLPPGYKPSGPPKFHTKG
jgi:tetratricopeptide (TPR) repeat protein